MIYGGDIPGLTGSAAFVAALPEPSGIPVLISVPHAGRSYPGSLLEAMRNPGFAKLRLEDRYVDRLAVAVARECGAALLIAQAPRAMIDLNRAIEDVDWDMVSGGDPDPSELALPGHRSRGGLGLVPRRLGGFGELWNQRLEAAALTLRIDTIHRPYHDQLAAMLQALHRRWGAALLLDLHSMPPLPKTAGQAPAEFVVGDRFGATCDGSLIGQAFAYLGAQGRRAAHNRPYAGGYTLDRHASPARGIHAIQLEIDRSSYLDRQLAEPGAGFESMVELLTGLVRELAAGASDLGRVPRAAGIAQAAE